MSVSTFGDLRIEAYLQLPEAYRSLSRPSSAPDAKAFTLCSYSLELPIGSRSLNCLSFIKQFLFFRISFAVKRFYPFHFRKLFHSTIFGETVVLPKFLERPILISLKCVLFYLFVSTLLLHLLFGFQWTLSLSGIFPWKLFLCRHSPTGRHEFRITLQRTASLDAEHWSASDSFPAAFCRW